MIVRDIDNRSEKRYITCLQQQKSRKTKIQGTPLMTSTAREMIPARKPDSGASWSRLPLELKHIIVQNLVPFSAISVDSAAAADAPSSIFRADSTPRWLWSLFGVGFSFTQDILSIWKRAHHTVQIVRAKLILLVEFSELKLTLESLLHRLQISSDTNQLAAVELKLDSRREALLQVTKFDRSLTGILTMYDEFRVRRCPHSQ